MQTPSEGFKLGRFGRLSKPIRVGPAGGPAGTGLLNLNFEDSRSQSQSTNGHKWSLGSVSRNVVDFSRFLRFRPPIVIFRTSAARSSVRLPQDFHYLAPQPNALTCSVGLASQEQQGWRPSQAEMEAACTGTPGAIGGRGGKAGAVLRDNSCLAFHARMWARPRRDLSCLPHTHVGAAARSCAAGQRQRGCGSGPTAVLLPNACCRRATAAAGCNDR